MLFNSIEFAVFLPIVFILYWNIFNRSLKVQNSFLLIVSYIFYGWWDWRFLFLLAFTSTFDFWIGLRLQVTDTTHKRKLLLGMSLLVNLGLLGFLKYFNFFIGSFTQAFTFFGYAMQVSTLRLILPVGLSFYTFQEISYTIDVYKKKIEPTRSLVDFLAFVSFFPQLVAGPIQRATHLLPQFHVKRNFDYEKAKDGMRQILWGLFKKIVIADNCATYVEDIFRNFQSYSGGTLLLGGILFAFQIYCDFSGYSDIAIGTAKLFGFAITRNFAFPYFSRDIAEFWRRWHISLSTWFRDYVYIPLGGSQGNMWMLVRNTFITFLLSGLWHGANWTFLAWGFLNAVYFLPLLILGKNRVYLNTVAEGRILPNGLEIFQIASTFLLTVVAWIFFRADNVGVASEYLIRMFSLSLFSVPQILPWKLLIICFLFFAVEWIQREKEHPLQIDSWSAPLLVRWSIYYTLVAVILLYGGDQQGFIYFQF